MLPFPSHSILPSSNSSSSSSSPPATMDISVLERQKAVLQRLYHQENDHRHPHSGVFSGVHDDEYQLQQLQFLHSAHNSIWHPLNNTDDEVDPRPQQPLNRPFVESVTNSNNNSSMTRMMTLPKSDGQCNSDRLSNGQANITPSSLKKRKAEFDVEEEEEDVKGKIEAEVEAEKSEITATKTNERPEISGNTCSKSGSEAVQKPDYIHVRARRGQATDSHSLAERARREKISKKMKCLQDLVPGCNKVTGKAGMLDEIINYVQSLQKQVEFLSMKLATLNPRPDFSMDHFLAKEIPAYLASLPAAALLEVTNNLQYSQQMLSICGLDLAAALDQSQIIPQKAPVNSSTPIPEAFLDSSCTNIPQLQQLFGWESDWPNLFNVGFH